MERIAGETQPPEGDPSPVVARFNSLGQEMTEEVSKNSRYSNVVVLCSLVRFLPLTR